MFDGVARGYDRTNAVLSVGNAALWRIATVRAVDPQKGERVLDIAAGTGTSSAALAKSGAEVIALDFSPGMVEEGRKRHPDLMFVQGDAEKLPFADGEFDAVTISFGLRNVQHPQVALAEMHRVLKPGGKLLVLEFSRVAKPLEKAYDWYSFKVLPRLGQLVAGDADSYRYLAESIRMHPDQDTLKGMMQSAGFLNVDYHNLTGGIVALHRGFK